MEAQTELRMKYLYMLVGLPLSGKTTFRNRMFNHFAGIIVSSDDLITLHAQMLGQTYNEAFQHYGDQANKQAFELGRYAAKRMVSVVWDQTNLTRKSRKPKLELFPSDVYYKVAYVLPLLGNEQLAERQKNPDREGKTIPESILNQMRASFEYPSPNEGFNEVRAIGETGSEYIVDAL